MFIKELTNKIQNVFKNEENVFSKNDCPKHLLDKEEIEHFEFIDKIQKISLDEQFKTVIQFTDLLKTFIINHIIGTDLECKKFLKDSYIHRFYGFEKIENILNNFISDKSLIKWGSYIETKISEIDEQHKTFTNILNELSVNYMIYDNDMLIDIIEELNEYISIHFKIEESYMQKISNVYSSKNHIEEHRIFAKYIQDISKELSNNNNIGSEEILKKLIEWSTEHLMGTDKEFARIYNLTAKN
jgi:hemerythrin